MARFSVGGSEVVASPVIGFQPDISAVLTALGQVAQASDDTTKKMSGGWAAAAKGIQQSQLVSQLETVSALSIQVGGFISRIGSIVTSSIRPVATLGAVINSMGADAVTLGLGLGSAAVGVVGMYAGVKGVEALGSAMVDLGIGAGEAGERLEKAGLVTTQHMREFGVLAQSEISFTKEMRAATEAAAVAQDLFTIRLATSVTVVGELTNAWAGLQVKSADAAGAFRSLTTEASDLRLEIQQSIPVFGDLLTYMDSISGPGNGNVGIFAPINEGLKSLAQSGKEASPELDRSRIAIEKLVNDPALTGKVYVDEHMDLMEPILEDAEMEKEALKDIIAGQREAARQAREYAAAMRELHSADQKLVQQEKARLSAQEQLKAAYDASNKALLDPRDQIQADLDIELAKITKMGEASGDYALAWKLADDAVLRNKLKLEAYDVTLKQSAADFKVFIDDTIREQKKATQALIRDTLTAELNYSGQMVGYINDIASAEIERVQTAVDAGQHLTREQAQQANAAVALQEAAAITQAGLSATVIGIETYAALIPILGPIGAAVAGSAAGIGSFASALAGIAAHKPPHFEFDSGPGHRKIADTPGADDGTGQGVVKGSGASSADTSGAVDAAGPGGKGGVMNRSSRGGGTVDLSPRLRRLVLVTGQVGKRRVR